jgi:hypothetical protein
MSKELKYRDIDDVENEKEIEEFEAKIAKYDEAVDVFQKTLDELGLSLHVYGCYDGGLSSVIVDDKLKIYDGNSEYPFVNADDIDSIDDYLNGEDAENDD